jgi:hypothetical protein
MVPQRRIEAASERRELGCISATEREAGCETGGMREPNGSFDMGGPMLIGRHNAF